MRLLVNGKVQAVVSEAEGLKVEVQINGKTLEEQPMDDSNPVVQEHIRIVKQHDDVL